jgi:translation initiation factor IF-2
MKKIRINVLARELEVKSHLILELLPDMGVTEKVTHSSSIDEDVADKLRVHFGLEPIGNREDSADHAHEAEGNGHGGVITVEEPPEKVEESSPAPPAPEVAQEPSKPATAPEPPVIEAPARPSPPIRPPIATQPAAPSRPVVLPAKPLPIAPRPGQVLSTPPSQAVSTQSAGGTSPAVSSHGTTLSGPRQPFPGGLPEAAHAPMIPRPPLVQRNLATPPPAAPQPPRAGATPSASPGAPPAPRPPAAAPRMPFSGTARPAADRSAARRFGRASIATQGSVSRAAAGSATRRSLAPYSGRACPRTADLQRPDSHRAARDWPARAAHWSSRRQAGWSAADAPHFPRSPGRGAATYRRSAAACAR